MRSYTNGSGEIIIQMSYPEAELLVEIISMAASGVGCHRGADYADRKLTRCLHPVISKAIEEVESEDEKEESEKSKRKARALSVLQSAKTKRS